MVGIEKYAPGEKAQQVKELVNDNFINTVSVGFVEKSPGEMVDVDGKSVYEFKAVELLDVKPRHILVDGNKNIPDIIAVIIPKHPITIAACTVAFLYHF